MFEYGNYYYRMNDNLIYRIPTDLETFKRDMKKVKVERYEDKDMKELTKNRESTIDKIRK